MDITKLKPSELVRVGLQDLLVMKNHSKYQINMYQWHTPAGGTCSICMAGAVMVQRLKAQPQTFYKPADFSLLENGALRALDALRIGHVDLAFYHLNIMTTIGSEFNREIEGWHNGRFKFVSDMLELASDLEDAGY